MVKKRTEIIIETERIILIKRRSHNYIVRCERCGGAAATDTFNMDDSGQAGQRREQPFRGSARGESEPCPQCGKK